MMFASQSIDTFKALWGKDGDINKWSKLLHLCYWEESYESAGGDGGYLENPPINIVRLKYLRELIRFLESFGVHAINDAPPISRGDH